jgi:hypothetical protein
MVKPDRAQLLLIASVLIALTIVASVVLLNAVYTPQTLRTGTVNTEATELRDTQHELRNELREYLNRVGIQEASANKPDPLPYAPDGVSVAADMRNISALYGNLVSARSGATLRIVKTGETVGDVVFQNKSTRTLTDGSGNSSWQVFSGVSSMPRVRLNLSDISGNNTSVVINGTTTSEQWTLNISEDAVAVNGRDQCGIATGDTVEAVRVDLVDGQGTPVVELDGQSGQEYCTNLTMAAGVTAPYNVSIDGGDSATGRYVMTADGSALTTTPTSDGPYSRTDKTINLDFRLVYVTTDITYASQFSLYSEDQR